MTNLSSRRMEKYFQMHKILPELAVKQKMKVDGLSEDFITYFFQEYIPHVNSNLESCLPPPPAIVFKKNIPENYNTYQNMSRLLPEAVVRQKMQIDGISPIDINYFFDTIYENMSVQSAQPELIFPVSSSIHVAKRARI